MKTNPPKPRPGRPPLPQGDVRDTRAVILLTTAEATRVDGAAQAAEVTRSEWIRRAILAAL